MPWTTPPVILVVEDDPVFRHLLRHTLRHADYDVVTAVDGIDAWECLQNQAIDLLVTDHQMPRCSGIELLERIHAARLQGNSPVDSAILCTGKRHEFDHASLRSRYGLLALLGKPFSPRKLVQTIAHVLPIDDKTGNEHQDPIGVAAQTPASCESWGKWAPTVGR